MSFGVDPPGARVGFSLALDGKVAAGLVFVGARRTRPSSQPFSFAGGLPSDILLKPSYRSGEEVAFFVWKNPGPSREESTELTDAMKQRLRSLGYVR